MCTVFVGDIGPDVKEYHLEDAFSSFGPVLSARIINDKPYGFVKFSQREHADRAIATMNGYILRGYVSLSEGNFWSLIFVCLFFVPISFLCL